jgi:hypothetical protein
VTRRRVARQHAEDQAPHPPLAGAGDRHVEERRADPLPLARRVDREALHFEDVAARLEVGPRPEQEAAEDRVAVDRDQHVLGAVALDHRPLGIRGRPRARPQRPGDDVEPAQDRLVALTYGADLDPRQLSFAAFSLQ